MKFSYVLLTGFIVSVIALLLAPVASAHSPLPFLSGPLVTCGGSSNIGCNTNELLHTFTHVIYFGISVALFVIAPVAFGWGGIMFLTSGGNEGRIGSAKKILTGTAIGVVIVLLSFLIVKTFMSVLGITEIAGFN